MIPHLRCLGQLGSTTPAAGILADLYRSADSRPVRQRLRGLSSPVTGTYQLAVAFAGAEPRTLYIRLGRQAREQLGLTTAVPDPSRRGRHTHTLRGYGLEVFGARSPDALPMSLRAPRPEPCDLSSVAVAIDSTRERDGSTLWRGEIDTGFLTRCFKGDSLARDAEQRVSAMWRERLEAAAPGTLRRRELLRRDLPAVFRLHGDGRLTVEQVTEHQGRPLITVRGERISTQALGPRW